MVLDPVTSRIRHLQATEQETLKFRLLALVAVALLVYCYQEEVEVFPLVFLILAYLVYSLFARSWLIPRGAAYAVYAMITVDVLAVMAALVFSGGVKSPVFVLCPVLVLYYAIYLGYSSSIYAAIAISLGYLAVAFIEGMTAEWGSTLAFQVPLFFLLALFGGYLSQRRLEERSEKEELQELIRLQSGARELLELAQAVGGSLSLEAALLAMVARAPSATGLAGCLLALQDGDRLTLRAGNIAPQALGEQRWEDIAMDGDLLAYVSPGFEAPVYLGSGGGPLPAWAEPLGLSSMLAVPLVAEGKPFGIMFLFDTSIGAPFSEDLWRRAGAFADLAAMTISNARRREEAEAKIMRLVGELESAITSMERLREERGRGVLEFGPLHIDGPKSEAFLDGRPLHLTPAEFDILYALAQSPGQPLNQETIMRRIRGESGRPGAVDVGVHRLRRKLEEDPADPRWVVTVRGAGYMLSPSPTSTLPTPRRRRRTTPDKS